jgi:aldehyde:ferredoxin oxidoreductase
MAKGFNGKILHVNLTDESIDVEEPGETFYRKYMGGSAMGAYYLIKKTTQGTNALEPGNTLCLMDSVVTGAPFSGQSRFSAVAKSPLSNLIGDSQAGGFWGPELKSAGFDGLVVYGNAKKPVYLWIHDGQVELKNAKPLWGHFTADVEDMIHEELGDKRIQVLQCGPASERGVRFGALVSNANRVNGRTGMGTVMASKNLKAVAVRGHTPIELADPEAVRSIAKWGAKNVDISDVAGLGEWGTAGIIPNQNKAGGLPTRNWESGTFEGSEAISGQTMGKTILKKRDTCYACVVRCKRVVDASNAEYTLKGRYGGPEYESIATLGTYCGVSDLQAIAYANQLCNMYGMDTISCGATIAWAMDCFEQGLLTTQDTGGVELRFGDAPALIRMIEQIGRREGFGSLLGEGSARAAEKLGKGRELVVAVKNSELPAHMPQVKRSLALIYLLNPFGADHCSHEHDGAYREYPDRMAELDLMDAQPAQVLNAEKVRFSLYTQYLYSCLDTLNICQFVFGPAWQLYGPSQLVDAVRAVTGWNVSLWELMKVGQRRLNLLQTFNIRERGIVQDDLPVKLFVPLKKGASDGISLNREEIEAARKLYYAMAGWDEYGRPKRATLEELSLGWLADVLEQH